MLKITSPVMNIKKAATNSQGYIVPRPAILSTELTTHVQNSS